MRFLMVVPLCVILSVHGHDGFMRQIVLLNADANITMPTSAYADMAVNIGRGNVHLQAFLIAAVHANIERRMYGRRPTRGLVPGGSL
jgi:hypothetical protein